MLLEKCCVENVNEVSSVYEQNEEIEIAIK